VRLDACAYRIAARDNSKKFTADETGNSPEERPGNAD
jgi:hypothetical protein